MIHRNVVLFCAAIHVLFVFAMSPASRAEPPRVINAVPDNGDTDVDPSVDEIRVVFDQDMKTGGFSWVGGGDAFPKTRGKPRWVDTRICVLPVRLEPNHEYWLSINSHTVKNFVGENGEPAVPYPIAFVTGAGESLSQEELGKEENEESIAQLRRAINEEYSYRDLRKVDWDILFDDYEPRLREARKPVEFAKVAAELLGYANDMHIWLKAGPARFGTAHRDVIRNYNLNTLSRIVPGWTEHNSTVSSGKFEDNIAYILIANWSWDNRDDLEPAFEMLDEFINTKALIVDVRPNGGGDERLAGYFAGCFIDQLRVYAKHVYRDIHSPDGFSEPSERIVRPKKGRPKYRGKVAVLTGEAIMSSCEAFLLMMKQVPGCVLVGDRSFGSSGNPKPIHLSNGVVVYLPSWKAMRPDGTVFEGEGIEPDIVVEAAESDFDSGDPVLEAALESLRSAAGKQNSTREY